MGKHNYQKLGTVNMNVCKRNSLAETHWTSFVLHQWLWNHSRQTLGTGDWHSFLHLSGRWTDELFSFDWKIYSQALETEKALSGVIRLIVSFVEQKTVKGWLPKDLKPFQSQLTSFSIDEGIHWPFADSTVNNIT